MSRVRPRAAGRAVVAAVAALVMAVTGVVVAAPAQAFSGSDFDPGYIISDTQFYDADAMSEHEIQVFLNSMIASTSAGSCQNWNCLAVHRTDTWTRAADRNICAQYTGGTQESAARIIFKVQQACGISARVLLVTLQKEQSLLTSPAPSDGKLRIAMGYGCPDTAPCDAQFYGFYNQMYKAAWQLKRYSTPDQWGYYQPGSRYIQYNPNPDCGGSWVNIQNNATAALYNYTPYQPNAESLSNLYGSGGVCGAHGNRNFWTYYYNWFGDPGAGISGIWTTRIGGATRYEAAVNISKAAFTVSPVPVMYIATGANYPDALTAGVAAARQNGPLLLVDASGLSDVVKAEIARLKPARVVVVGGPNSVPDTILTELGTLVGADKVTRVGGADRYEASRNIIAGAFAAGTVPHVYIATGANFPDALSAGAAGAVNGSPVLLVPGYDTAPDAATLELLRALGVTSVTIVGGPNSVSAAMESSLATEFSTRRLSGADRYEVSRLIAQDLFASAPPPPTEVLIATGLTYPDALAGAVLAWRKRAALVVSPGWCVPAATISMVQTFGSTTVTLLGGPNSLNTNVKYMVSC